VRRSLKAVVTWPPLNSPVTGALRAVLPAPVRNRPWVARYLPRAGVVEATLPSGALLRMWSRGDDDIASTIFWRGWAGHEPATAKPFFDLAVSSSVTLDIGAHVGYFALLASLANPAGLVYAFEPLPRVRERLLRNVALNGVANVSCQSVALGPAEGKATFFHVEDGIPSSSSLSGEFMRSIVDPRRLASSEVDVTTVDEFVADHGLAGRVELVKVDTENTEDEVFHGMARTLETDRPTIFCEVLKADTGRAIEAILGPLDYRFFHLTDEGLRSTAGLRPHRSWRNFAFVPLERAADVRVETRETLQGD
jgi:FkbM family methyltransferase